MHLRAMRRSYFSTNRIDMDALFAWGFPHSQAFLAKECIYRPIDSIHFQIQTHTHNI